MKNPNELITLKQWDSERCPNNPHHPNTLRNWTKEGKIQPEPIKIGRRYLVKRKAKYYDLGTGQTA